MEHPLAEARREALARNGFKADEEQGFLYAPNEVLVVGRRHAEAGAPLRADLSDSDPELGASVYKIGGRDSRISRDGNVREIVRDFNGAEALEGTVASPHFVFVGEPVYHGGPFGGPEPVSDPYAPRSSSAGAGVTIAVLDTGFVEKTSARLRERCVVSPSDVDPIDTRPYRGLAVENGHGTFIAGIIHSRAPRSEIIVARVLNADGCGTEFPIARRLRACLRSHTNASADIVNLSFGAYTDEDRPPILLTEALASMPTEAVAVAAAGNHGCDRKMWPAAFAGEAGFADCLISVGALEGAEPADWSNHGDWVRTWAPGANIVSAFAEYQPVGPMLVPKVFEGVAQWSGTSFAAPYVAGEVAALITGTGHRSARAAAAAYLARPDLRG